MGSGAPPPQSGGSEPRQERGPQDLVQVAGGRAGPTIGAAPRQRCLPRARGRSPGQAGPQPPRRGPPDGRRVPGLRLSYSVRLARLE